MNGLWMARAAWDAMIEHAERGYPHEVVGVLAGHRDGRALEAVPLLNERADSPANRYKVSGLVLARAEEAIEDRGLEVVGYYHSHPDHPADYSDYDREHALPNMAYPIVSVRDGRADRTLAWRLSDDRAAMHPLPLTLQEPPMTVTIKIPTALRAFTGGEAKVAVSGATAGDALRALTDAHPGLARHLRAEDGSLRSFVNVYKNDEDIRYLGEEAAPLVDGDVLTIVPSIAGGAR